jgi:hypothetical protein
MARKPKEAPHLRLRVEHGLLTQLKKDAEKNAHTLTGEIVQRLEKSYDQADRVAILRETLERAERVGKEYREEASRLRSEAYDMEKKAKIEFAEQIAQVEIKFAEHKAQLEREIERHAASATMVDVLVGENSASRDLLRRVAHELMSAPDWDRSEAGREAMMGRIASYIYSKEHLADSKNDKAEAKQ